MFEQRKHSPLLVFGLGLVVMLSSACHVVVPRFAAATEFGFNLSGNFDPEEPYAVGTLQCKTELYPNIIFPTENAAPPTGYLGTLNAAFPTWTFNTATTGLSDDAIEIKTYDAIGTSTRVGVWIHARYVPHGTDPTTNIHWVQILTTNHGLKGTGHGSSATYLDTNSSIATTPYYDDGYAADATDIIDRPSRSDASANHTWEATSFLVTGPAVGAGAGTVTLLGPGFTWGWKNTCLATDGLAEFYFYWEQTETVQLTERPRPGGKLQLVNENPRSMVLGQVKSRATVPVHSQEITFAIDKEDPWGVSELTGGEGRISVGEYDFEGTEMPAVTAEISGGTGNIHWETGEASLQYMVALTLPDGKMESMVFTGTGLYDKEVNSFTLNSDMQGISAAFLKRNVPKDTRKDKEK